MEKINTNSSLKIADANILLATKELAQEYEVVKIAFDETIKAAQTAIQVAEQVVYAVEEATGKIWLSGKVVKNVLSQVRKAQSLAEDARNCEIMYRTKAQMLRRSVQKQRQEYANQYKQFADNTVKTCLSNNVLCKSVMLNPNYTSVLLQEKVWNAHKDFMLSLHILNDILSEFNIKGERV